MNNTSRVEFLFDLEKKKKPMMNCKLDMFKLKQMMLQMLQTFEKFHWLPFEDSYLYLKSYIGVSDSFKFQGANKEWIRLSLFSYLLRDVEKSW